MGRPPKKKTDGATETNEPKVTVETRANRLAKVIRMKDAQNVINALPYDVVELLVEMACVAKDACREAEIARLESALAKLKK
jgi:predicted short-subunit dehydrogenase-like oxidoreductase (DUF2520 family)